MPAKQNVIVDDEGTEHIWHPAEIAKLKAEAAHLKAQAEAAKYEGLKLAAEALEASAKARVAQIDQAKAEESEAKRLVSDDHRHVYRFVATVDANSVKTAVKQLNEWHRLDPGCDIKFLIDSGGGSILDGNHLIDTLLWLRDEGHHVTTIGLGTVASMAGVLLQTGTTRVMGRNAVLLIHEAKYMVGGSQGMVEDQVEFAKKLQEKLLGLLAERSVLTKQQIRNRWRRKDWWLSADEALKLGFVDELR